MKHDHTFEIFLMAQPGLEEALYHEVRHKGFKSPKTVPGGVTIVGGWKEVWRANLWVRGAGRVLARVGRFKCGHLSDLTSLARTIAWQALLPPDLPFELDVTCKKSRIYHSDAAAERIAAAITQSSQAVWNPETAEICIKARFEHDVCTLSVDTTGELLHKRGYKEALNRAPMRETMASLFLVECGYIGTEPVIDPMCGAGTFVIEAAEIALRLNPGRNRSFAFEKLATYDGEEWQKMKAVKSSRPSLIRFWGSDRDNGAIQRSVQNAQMAGVDHITSFHRSSISEITRPDGPTGLVIMNPPYGVRIGDKKKLLPLYQSIGTTMMSRFKGWRIGLITTDHRLAQATDLPFLPTKAPVQHGGLRVTLYQTPPLPET